MLRLSLSNVGTVGAIPAVPFHIVRVVGAALGILLCASVATRAESRLDPQLREEMRIRGGMRNLHHSMMLAEHNLAAALLQRDVARVHLVIEYLVLAAAKPAVPRHACVEAAQGLQEAVGSAGFVIDQNAMTVKIDDEQTIDLRPDRNAIDKAYSDGFSKYKNSIDDCEQQIGVAGTRRVMPDRLPWAK
ncbi:hypothetical protein [Methylorubrum salsuginis]|uniref:hypothetical protein n=1 Tax=Methylorubrum salsuginis TaxID=414703 RepID=UPI001041D589|nr:hypothetical protein [Methylorubrum salsuginis]